jgi:hypothetical protein
VTDEQLSLLQELEGNPRDLRFARLLKVMQGWDFELITMKKGGHGIKFRHKVHAGLIVTAAKPKGKQRVKICYVVECRKALYEIQRREEQNYA